MIDTIIFKLNTARELTYINTYDDFTQTIQTTTTIFIYRVHISRSILII